MNEKFMYSLCKAVYHIYENTHFKLHEDDPNITVLKTNIYMMRGKNRQLLLKSNNSLTPHTFHP